MNLDPFGFESQLKPQMEFSIDQRTSTRSSKEPSNYRSPTASRTTPGAAHVAYRNEAGPTPKAYAGNKSKSSNGNRFTRHDTSGEAKPKGFNSQKALREDMHKNPLKSNEEIHAHKAGGEADYDKIKMHPNDVTGHWVTHEGLHIFISGD